MESIMNKLLQNITTMSLISGALFSPSLLLGMKMMRIQPNLVMDAEETAAVEFKQYMIKNGTREHLVDFTYIVDSYLSVLPFKTITIENDTDQPIMMEMGEQKGPLSPGKKCSCRINNRSKASVLKLYTNNNQLITNIPFPTEKTAISQIYLKPVFLPEICENMEIECKVSDFLKDSRRKELVLGYGKLKAKF
jgi:hypothetical protein